MTDYDFIDPDLPEKRVEDSTDTDKVGSNDSSRLSRVIDKITIW